MIRRHIRLLPLTLCLGALALSACSTTGGAPAAGTSAATDSNAINMEQAGARVDAAFKRALADAEKSGNPQDVIQVMAPYFKRHPDNPVLAARYGRALREDNQLNAAQNILAPFTKGEKAHAEPLTEMAMTQLGLGNYKEAEKAARKAIELDEKAGRAHLALGTSLDAQSKYADAEDAFRKGLRVWRGDAAPILNNLALNLASQGQTQQALELLDRARQQYPNRPELERNYRIIATLNDRDYHPRQGRVDIDRSEEKKEENSDDS